MTRSKPKRRWWQFSLRSLLLVTLAVALWLGYEVRQVRYVEQTVAALRELGGDAETELTGWSLLRLCGVPGYGRQIVRAEIPGSAAEVTVDLLRGSPALREMQVKYDGTYDPAPSWKALRSSLSGVTLSPAVEQASGCESRIASKALATYSTTDVQRLFVDMRRVPRGTLIGTRTYRIVQLPDNSLAEILIGSAVAGWHEATYFAVLVVHDKCVGIRGFYAIEDIPVETLLEDIDGDGAVELAFEWTDKATKHSSMRQIAGDARDWLGVYRIEADGFRSLLAEDLFDVPGNESIVQNRRIEWRDPRLNVPDAREERTHLERDVESALPPTRSPTP